MSHDAHTNDSEHRERPIPVVRASAYRLRVQVVIATLRRVLVMVISIRGFVEASR
jgi:hypothetical protein